MVDDDSSDIHLINGQVLTLDAKSRVAQGLVVRGNRIHTIGSTRALKKRPGRHSEVHRSQRQNCPAGFYRRPRPHGS